MMMLVALLQGTLLLGTEVAFEYIAEGNHDYDQYEHLLFLQW